MLLTEAPPDEQWMEDLVFRLKVNNKRRCLLSLTTRFLIAMLLGIPAKWMRGSMTVLI